MKAKVFTKLFFRHWDEYVEDKRQHLFVISASPGRKPGEYSEPRDVTPGDRDAYPTSTTFSSGDDFTFSPDGKYLVFTAVPDEGRSVEHQLRHLPRDRSTNKSPKWETLTKDNKAADSGPQFSARRQEARVARAEDAPATRPTSGTSSSRIAIRTARPKGKPFNATAKFDVSVNEFAWNSGYDRAFLFTADDDGRTPIFIVQVEGTGFKMELDGGTFASLSTSLQRNMLSYTEAGDRSARGGQGTLVAGQPRQAGRGVARQRRAARRARPPATGIGQGPGRRDGRDADVDPQAAGLRPRRRNGRSRTSSTAGRRARGRTAGATAGTRNLWAAQGYVVALPNPRGSHRLRPEVRRRDHRRLGRQVLPRPHGRARLPREAALRRQGPHRARPAAASAAT